MKFLGLGSRGPEASTFAFRNVILPRAEARPWREQGQPAASTNNQVGPEADLDPLAPAKLPHDCGVTIPGGRVARVSNQKYGIKSEFQVKNKFIF